MPARAARFLPLFCFVLSSAAFGDNWHKEYKLTGTPELHMSTGDVHLRVEPWDKDYVAVDVTTVNWKINEGPQSLEIRDYQRDNYIDITFTEHTRFVIGWARERRGEAVVHMPAKAVLDLRTSDGSLEVARMSGEFRLHTSDGHLTATDLSGTLVATTSDGRMAVSGRFTGLRTQTSDGRMEVRVEPGSALTSAWSLRSGDGSIRLQLPKELNANLDVHLGDGHLDLDLPVTVNGRFGSHDLRGKLGAGGELLTIRAGDGSVRISSL